MARTIIIGEEFTSNKGHVAKVVEYKGYKHGVTIEYPSGEQQLIGVQNLRLGRFYDCTLRSHSGVGFIGLGKYQTYSQGRKTREYVHWRNMLYRCYNTDGRFAAYKGTTVCDEWHSFQVFAEWCHSQANFADNELCLDKDIINKGSTAYCAENCSFVPNDVNILFASRKSLRGDCPLGVCFDKSRGLYHSCLNRFKVQVNLGRFQNELDAFLAYKKAKELYIQEVANMYKELILPKTYEAMMQYKIEITD